MEYAVTGMRGKFVQKELHMQQLNGVAERKTNELKLRVRVMI